MSLEIRELHKPVMVRQVWAHNADHEFALIRSALGPFRYASMDTEFPGTVYSHPSPPKHGYSSVSPVDTYKLMKRNVDALKLIQVGLTLSDEHGNLPDFGTRFCYIWEFNFRNFDVDKDVHNTDSIELLKRQGIDFMKNRYMGIDYRHFAFLFMVSGLCVSSLLHKKLTWITFHSSYDFGFLIRILTGRKLPRDLDTFMILVRFYFGVAVFDIKEMIKDCGLYGGLEKVARSLDVDRVAGKSHQAGSDSLLTAQTFVKLKEKYFTGREESMIDDFNYKLHGLCRSARF